MNPKAEHQEDVKEFALESSFQQRHNTIPSKKMLAQTTQVGGSQKIIVI